MNFKPGNIFIVSGIMMVILLFSSCKKENMCDCIKRTGRIITVKRDLAPFDRIQAEQDVSVLITQDTVQEVTVEAGENIEPLIQTVIEDGILIIRNKNRCNWARRYDQPLNVHIRTPGLKYITSDGTGTIRSTNTLTRDTMEIEIQNSGNIELTVNSNQVISHIYGAGDLTLYGTTYEHACSIGGASFLYAQHLNTTYTWVQTFTTGLCFVKTYSRLICRIDDVGDVHCKGNPTNITSTINGKGQLILE